MNKNLPYLVAGAFIATCYYLSPFILLKLFTLTFGSVSMESGLSFLIFVYTWIICFEFACLKIK